MNKELFAELLDNLRVARASMDRLQEMCEDTLRKPELYLVDDETTFTGEIHFEADFDVD